MAGGDLETASAGAAALLLPPSASSLPDAADHSPPPADRLGISYLVFFTLGAGFLLPWNAFSINRVFSVAYKLSCLFPLLLIVLCFPKVQLPSAHQQKRGEDSGGRERGATVVNSRWEEEREAVI